MADWEKEIAELRTDVKHMLQSQETMQQEKNIIVAVRIYRR